MSDAVQPKISAIKDFSPNHARITLGPFERGYGHTLGNALRRVIISSLPGFAATSVRIEGAEHPYMSLEGVTEDVINILLNIKGVAFRIDGAPRAEVALHGKGPGAVTAGDLQLPGGVHVLNPEHHIATLSKGAQLDMTITVEAGQGYRMAPIADKMAEKTLGVINLDASFSPVHKVTFSVESTRVGDRTDLDRLVIEIKTTGVYNPEQIIRFAARKLTTQLQTFAELDRDSMPIEARPDSDRPDPKLYEPIEMLELPVRETNNLKQEHIMLVGELVGKSEKDLMEMPRIGKKAIDRIKIALAEHNLTLGMNVGDLSRGQQQSH
ncbi:MAG: DNA-directed RNA polymerase subunit alpha [Betaproteobacteria bacterium]|nr:DNA-directed RNA polymerase subunit alpha [Betaproteobacteria bacterium]